MHRYEKEFINQKIEEGHGTLSKEERGGRRD